MSRDYQKEAVRIIQEATDMRALRKLLAKVQEIRPSVIVEAWEQVGLVGHTCPACQNAALKPSENAYHCPSCCSFFMKKPVI